MDDDIRKALGVSADEVFFKGAGCIECGGTGYHGRVAVYEILEMTQAIRNGVRSAMNEDALTALAIREGMIPLGTQALQLARNKVISLLEVFRSRLD